MTRSPYAVTSALVVACEPQKSPFRPPPLGRRTTHTKSESGGDEEMSAKDKFTWNVSATIERGNVSEFKFTPSPTPTPPAAYHNVFPPITSEGIQEAAKRLRELRAQWDKEDAEIFASVPMPERLPPRVPDLCPDDMGFARVDIIKAEQRRIYDVRDPWKL
jgi:hypothetical protein